MKEVRGVVLPSPTVFRADGSVDEPLMRELTDWFVACGVHAFFILGSYGQGAALQPEERKKVAEIIVQQVKHRVPVVVHIGAVDPYTAIDLGKHAKAIGAEAIGHVGPYYYADRSEYEIIEHLKMVDRAVGMPMLIYNNPRYSGYNIHPQFMARLVEAVPNIFGAKLAMGSVDEAMACMKLVIAPFAAYALARKLVSAMAELTETLPRRVGQTRCTRHDAVRLLVFGLGNGRSLGAPLALRHAMTASVRKDASSTFRS